MFRYVFALFAVVVFCGCQKDDAALTEGSLYGTWTIVSRSYEASTGDPKQDVHLVELARNYHDYRHGPLDWTDEHRVTFTFTKGCMDTEAIWLGLANSEYEMGSREWYLSLDPYISSHCPYRIKDGQLCFAGSDSYPGRSPYVAFRGLDLVLTYKMGWFSEDAFRNMPDGSSIDPEKISYAKEIVTLKRVSAHNYP